MIQAVQNNNFKAYLSLEDSRLNNTAPTSQIRHLFKFTNDMDKAVFYAYPLNETPYGERYTECPFVYNATPNMFAGELNLKPAGYFKYEVYEVWWGIDEVGGGYCTPTLNDVYAPSTERDTLGINCGGLVMGLVAIGKLYLGETSGSEEVQYLEHPEPTGTNYIYTS